METRWGLTAEEIVAVWVANRLRGDLTPTSQDELIVQATLRHVWEEGEKNCPHQPLTTPGIAPKRLCDECWTELKKEGGL